VGEKLFPFSHEGIIDSWACCSDTLNFPGRSTLKMHLTQIRSYHISTISLHIHSNVALPAPLCSKLN